MKPIRRDYRFKEVSFDEKSFCFYNDVFIMTSLLAGCGNKNQVQSGTELTAKEDNQAPVAEEERNEISSEESDLETDSAAELPVVFFTKDITAEGLVRIIVGVHAENYTDWVILSHFKGHAMAGFGGAIKNVGIGISSPSGKVYVHTAGTKTSGSIWYSDQDAWLEALAEMVKGFNDHVGSEHMPH